METHHDLNQGTPLPTPSKWALEKAAHKAGKRIQFKDKIATEKAPWIDTQTPQWNESCIYRIHPDDDRPTERASGEASRLDKALQVLESDSAKSFVRDLVQQSKDCHIFWDHDDPHVEIDVPGRFAVQVYDPEFSPAEVAVNPMAPPPNATEPRSAGEAADTTLRQHYAGLAMQGLLSNLSDIRREGFKDGDIAIFAVMQADRLIEQLKPL